MEGEKLTLIVRHLVAGLIDSREREVAIFAYFTVLDSAPGQWGVAGSREFLFMLVLERETDGLPAEPVANVVLSWERSAAAHW